METFRGLTEMMQSLKHSNELMVEFMGAEVK